MPGLLSPSVARNKLPILNVLRTQVETLLRPESPQKVVRVLEVASGAGEHAAFFCSQIPHLLYQPSEPDVTMADSIIAWSRDLGVASSSDSDSEAQSHISAAPSSSSTSTVLMPLSVGADQLTDVSFLPPCMLGQHPSSAGVVDLLLCINMIHISPFSSTLQLFEAARAVLRPGGLVLLYGPFREEDEHGRALPLCASNKAFDESLRGRDERWGIRSLGDVVRAGEGAGVVMVERVEMPANNLCVVFKKMGVDE